jgi:hypothetical protein
MQRSTLIGLALAVLGLVALVLWQDQREQSHARDEGTPLFEGVDVAAVTAVRIESVERDLHLRAERDANGTWNLVDPVAVRAQSELFDFLVQSALTRRGMLVPESEGDAQSLGFEPPRAILELESRSNGNALRQRLELGALDLDGTRMYVRVRGRILRTLRDLDTTLARSIDDFKSRSVVELDARDVVEVQRAGRATFERGVEPLDLALHALVDGEQWRASEPVRAALDPVAMSLWIQGATRLEAGRFVEDGAAALADYGLDPSEFSVELVTSHDARATVHFGRPGHALGAPWFARLSGQAPVWGIEEQSARLLASPIEDLLDHRLVRRRSEAIDGITLRSNERELLLARRGRVWNVCEKRGLGSFSTPRPADQGRVDDLLGRMESLEFAGFVLDRPFEPSPGGEILSIESGTDVQGGSIGARFTSASGAVARQFQRPGESVVALVDPSLLELVHTPLEELLSLRLLDILEIDQASLRIAGLGSERRYVRGRGGVWAAPDLAVRAEELDPVLDPLLFLRAERHRPAEAQLAFDDPITIEFTNKSDVKTVFTLGLTPRGDGQSGGPEVDVEIDGRRALLAKKDQGLYGKLAALLK